MLVGSHRVCSLSFLKMNVPDTYLHPSQFPDVHLTWSPPSIRTLRCRSLGEATAQSPHTRCHSDRGQLFQHKHQASTEEITFKTFWLFKGFPVSRIHLLSYLSGVEAPVLAEGYRVLDPGGATPDKVDGHVLPVIVVAAIQAKGITSTLQPIP